MVEEKWYENRQRLKSEGKYNKYIGMSGSNAAQFKIPTPSQLKETKINQNNDNINKYLREKNIPIKEKIKKEIQYKKEKEQKEKQKRSKSNTKSKFLKSLSKSLSKKLPSKRILKRETPTLTIKQGEVPSVLGDPNRFFKDEMQKEFEL